MTLCRVFSFLICLLVFALSTTVAHADTWAYTFSGTNRAPSGSGLSYLAPGAVTGSALLFSSPFSSCTTCLASSSVSAGISEPESVSWHQTALNDILNFRNSSMLPVGALAKSKMYVSGALLNAETVTGQVAQGSVSSTVAPESSSIALLLGGFVCIIVGVRGKAKLS